VELVLGALAIFLVLVLEDVFLTKSLPGQVVGVDVAGHVGGVLAGSRFAVINVLIFLHLLVLLVLQRVADVVVSSLDSISQYGGGLCAVGIGLDQDSLANGDDASGGLSVHVLHSDSHMECHVLCHYGLIPFVYEQSVFLDAISDL
jgi:hypothetical protein